MCYYTGVLSNDRSFTVSLLQGRSRVPYIAYFFPLGGEQGHFVSRADFSGEYR